jgi:hypothetical protein
MRDLWRVLAEGVARHRSEDIAKGFGPRLGVPRFDRIAVPDLAIFADVAPPADLVVGAPVAVLGFPVFVDATVEAGFAELRDGDRFVERVSLSAV